MLVAHWPADQRPARTVQARRAARGRRIPPKLEQAAARVVDRGRGAATSSGPRRSRTLAAQSRRRRRSGVQRPSRPIRRLGRASCSVRDAGRASPRSWALPRSSLGADRAGRRCGWPLAVGRAVPAASAVRVRDRAGPPHFAVLVLRRDRPDARDPRGRGRLGQVMDRDRPVANVEQSAAPDAGVRHGREARPKAAGARGCGSSDAVAGERPACRRPRRVVRKDNSPKRDQPEPAKAAAEQDARAGRSRPKGRWTGEGRRGHGQLAARRNRAAPRLYDRLAAVVEPTPGAAAEVPGGPEHVAPVGELAARRPAAVRRPRVRPPARPVARRRPRATSPKPCTGTRCWCCRTDGKDDGRVPALRRHRPLPGARRRAHDSTAASARSRRRSRPASRSAVDPKLPLEISHTDAIDVPVRVTNDSDDPRKRRVHRSTVAEGLKTADGKLQGRHRPRRRTARAGSLPPEGRPARGRRRAWPSPAPAAADKRHASPARSASCRTASRASARSAT